MVRGAIRRRAASAAAGSAPSCRPGSSRGPAGGLRNGEIVRLVGHVTTHCPPLTPADKPLSHLRNRRVEPCHTATTLFFLGRKPAASRLRTSRPTTTSKAAQQVGPGVEALQMGGGLVGQQRRLGAGRSTPITVTKLALPRRVLAPAALPMASASPSASSRSSAIWKASPGRGRSRSAHGADAFQHGRIARLPPRRRSAPGLQPLQPGDGGDVGSRALGRDVDHLPRHHPGGTGGLGKARHEFGAHERIGMDVGGGDGPKASA